MFFILKELHSNKRDKKLLKSFKLTNFSNHFLDSAPGGSLATRSVTTTWKIKNLNFKFLEKKKEILSSFQFFYYLKTTTVEKNILAYRVINRLSNLLKTRIVI